MTKERTPIKIDKRETKALQLITSSVLPNINRLLRAYPFKDQLDPSKLITEVVVGGSLADLQEKERTEQRPIAKRFPYYDALVELGVKPSVIEDRWYCISRDIPFDRDLIHSPNRLVLPRNFPMLFGESIATIANAIIENDISEAPQLNEVKNPGLKSVAKKLLKEQTIEIYLRRLIEESGLDFEDKKFGNIKTRIAQDLDSEQTRVFFFGATILEFIDGPATEDISSCTFRTNLDLHKGIARLLTKPVIEAVLPFLGFNPIDVHAIMREIKNIGKDDIELINETVGLDFSLNGDLDEDRRALRESERRESYNQLLTLYLESQIPLIAVPLS